MGIRVLRWVWRAVLYTFTNTFLKIIFGKDFVSRYGQNRLTFPYYKVNYEMIVDFRRDLPNVSEKLF